MTIWQMLVNLKVSLDFDALIKDKWKRDGMRFMSLLQVVDRRRSFT